MGFKVFPTQPIPGSPGWKMCEFSVLNWEWQGWERDQELLFGQVKDCPTYPKCEAVPCGVEGEQLHDPSLLKAAAVSRELGTLEVLPVCSRPLAVNGKTTNYFFNIFFLHIL